MKTSALRIAGASALLAWGAAGLTACGTPTASADLAKNAVTQAASPASSATATLTATPAPTQTATPTQAKAYTPTATSTPTQTATPTQSKAYTSKELTALVAQLKDAHGKPLHVMSSADLKKSIDQAKSELASITVKPAECAPLALGSQMPSTEGLAVAAGAAADLATRAITGISLTSAAGSKALSQGLGRPEVFNKCSNLSMTARGTKVDVKLTKLAGLGSNPATIAYRTDTSLPGGQKQSAITGMVVQNGVLVTVTASGGSSEADAVSRAGKLLDQATALVGK
jgi:hypothetical protein